MSEVKTKTEEPKTTITRWIFATDSPRTCTLSSGGTAPGRWEDNEWIEPKTIEPAFAEFNQYSGLYITQSKRNAKLLQGFRSFRTDMNPHGNIWLVKTEERPGVGEAIPATAPAPKPRPSTIRGSRGTSDVARQAGIKGIKKIKSDG